MNLMKYIVRKWKFDIDVVSIFELIIIKLDPIKMRMVWESLNN